MPDFYSIQQVAEILKMSKQAVHQAIKSGRLKAEKVGKGYIILEREFRLFESLPAHILRGKPRNDNG
jgi:excisionase family DNA binding protein